jgi:hypothetical protein
MCTWLTTENQRLRDALKLSKHLDSEIDELLEDAEDDCASRVTAENERDAAIARAEQAERELERWRHGATIEGDFVCPNDLRVMRLSRLEAAAREWRAGVRIKLQHARGSASEVRLAKAIDALTTEQS